VFSNKIENTEMAWKNLHAFVEALEAAGELVRIKTYVNPELEITEIVDRVSKHDGPALLFENTGTDFPLLINSMGSYRRMCMALGVQDMDDITREIESLFHELTGPKEGILDKLKMLPKLGRISSWMPRVKSGSRRHYHAYKEAGKKMPVAIALGGDPVYTYAGTAPLPDGIDEYILAGFLRKKRVELVRCLTQPEIEVPADADIVIEGYVDPEEDLIWEGPFGDHTGYYSLPDWYPRFHITAITHRRDAIYPSTIVGIPPQEDAWIGKATERIFLAPIKTTAVPEILDMDLPIHGVFHNLAIVQIHKTYPGQAQKVMNSLWGCRADDVYQDDADRRPAHQPEGLCRPGQLRKQAL